MHINRIVRKTAVEGPGMRFCVWVQGCGRHCPGCFNPETWPYDGGTEYTVEQLTELVDGTDGIEGVTLLGGEPFDQPDELLVFCQVMKERGLSVVAFSGYTLQELLALSETHRSVLACVDLLLDGPYREEQQDFSRPWVGSSNQQFHFLSSRYTWEDVKNCKNRVEIRITPQGGLIINGMPDREMQKLIQEKRKEHEIRE